MSSYICMPSHQYIGVEWVTSGFLSKGVYCLRVHYGLVRFLNPLAQSQAHILITPLSFLSANESQRKVGRTFLVETDAKYRIEQTTREKQWRVVWGKVKVKVKKLNNLPSKKNKKILRKTKKQNSCWDSCKVSSWTNSREKQRHVVWGKHVREMPLQ